MSPMCRGPVASMLSDQTKDKDMKSCNTLLCEKDIFSQTHKVFYRWVFCVLQVLFFKVNLANWVTWTMEISTNAVQFTTIGLKHMRTNWMIIAPDIRFMEKCPAVLHRWFFSAALCCWCSISLKSRQRDSENLHFCLLSNLGESASCCNIISFLTLGVGLLNYELKSVLFNIINQELNNHCAFVEAKKHLRYMGFPWT